MESKIKNVTATGGKLSAVEKRMILSMLNKGKRSDINYETVGQFVKKKTIILSEMRKNSATATILEIQYYDLRDIKKSTKRVVQIKF